MILAFGGVYLCEVDTEEQAFAEMCRFLEVNNLPSDSTLIRVQGDIKFVEMRNVIPYSGFDTVGDFRVYYHGAPCSSLSECWISAPDDPNAFEKCWVIDPNLSTEKIMTIQGWIRHYLGDLKDRKNSGKFPMSFESEGG